MFSGELHAHFLADVIDRTAADEAVGTGEVDVLEDARARGRMGKGRCVSRPCAVITITSPLSTSRTNSAPTMSSAQVSEAENVGVAEAALDEGRMRSDRGRRSSCRW